MVVVALAMVSLGRCGETVVVTFTPKPLQDSSRYSNAKLCSRDFGVSCGGTVLSHSPIVLARNINFNHLEL